MGNKKMIALVGIAITSVVLVFLFVPVTAIGFENDDAEAQEIIIDEAIEAIIDQGIDTGLLEIPFVCASVTECEEILDPEIKTPIEIITDMEPPE